MTAEDFVQSIIKEVLNANQSIYKNILQETSLDDVSDLYWKDLLDFYNKISNNQKELLLKVIRQVTVDTLSNFFGILDGVTLIEDQGGDFDLIYSGTKLNGELQDIFLEKEEEV